MSGGTCHSSAKTDGRVATDSIQLSGQLPAADNVLRASSIDMTSVVSKALAALACRPVNAPSGKSNVRDSASSSSDLLPIARNLLTVRSMTLRATIRLEMTGGPLSPHNAW